MMEGDASRAADDQVQHLMARGEYRAALEGLVRSYQHLIVRYCVALLGDTGHGEEVAREVFLGTYTAMRRFRQEASLRT
jgi:DNA-directed RNA polymerase specialized sigma24 family protein